MQAAGIGCDIDRAKKQAGGFTLLETALVTLVDVSPPSHIGRLAELLANEYDPVT